MYIAQSLKRITCNIFIKILFHHLIHKSNKFNQKKYKNLLISASVNDGVEIFDASADDPPDYESPPDYEEVVKCILSGNNLKVMYRYSFFF